MKVTIRVISDLDGLHEIESSWNAYINRHSENPFLLSGFVEQFMKSCRLEGWTPMILMISSNNWILGISPLKIKRKFGVRFAKFISGRNYFPDFVSEDQYREICIERTLNFLFATLKCQFINIVSLAESPNLRTLRERCEDKGTHFFTSPEMGHRILPVKCTWDEFEKLQGKKFRQEFRYAERNLARVGSWRITHVEQGNSETDITARIVAVDRISWKQTGQSQGGFEIDPDLIMFWNGSLCTARIEPQFKWRAWFLELNGKTLSYVLVAQYKKIAYFAKTSYDERYRGLYPGKFVMTTAIRQLFNERQVRYMDFETDLPYLRTYTSICLPRVRIILSQKRVFAIMIKFLTGENMKRIFTIVLSLLKKGHGLHADLYV